MTAFRPTLRPILAVITCASITACADSPPRQTDLDYRSRPAPAARNADSGADSSGQRLTIQSGEGERLNLPWFIRDTQDWVNSQ